MKIKGNEPDKFFHSIKRGLGYLWKKIYNKITKKTLGVIFIILFFIFGLIVGLTISGYFGTFDQPSGRAYKLLSSIGINNLHEMKLFAQGISKNNIQVPVNYFKGLFSSPKKLTINIKFGDLQKIEFKRQQAIELGTLISSKEDYVPAKITYEDKNYDVKIRLKGDLPDHWEGDKWSFRIKVGGEERLMGMKIFSIQNPATRQELNEWLYHKLLKKEGLIGLRYKFVEIVINGENKGIFALEEHFSKELIENNERREGLIFKFSEDLSFMDSAKRDSLKPLLVEEFYKAPIEIFEGEEKVLNNSIKKAQFEKGMGLLESFRKGNLSASEVFDTEMWGKYYAIGTLLNCPHGKIWHNTRMYYNPITSLFEPIGFDGNCRIGGAQKAFNEYIPRCIIIKEDSTCPFIPEDLSFMILRNEEVFKSYIKELEKISSEKYVRDLFEGLTEEIERNKRIMYKEDAFYYFSQEYLINSARQIREIINPLDSLNSYFGRIQENNSKIKVVLGNKERLPIELINVRNGKNTYYPIKERYFIQPRNLSTLPQYIEYTFLSNRPLKIPITNNLTNNLSITYKIFGTDKIRTDRVSQLNYMEKDFIEKDFIRQRPNLEDFEMIELNKAHKQIKILKGNWIINKSLIIPEGYNVIISEGTTLDLIENSMILSFSKMYFGGSKEKKIRIFSSDKTGQGLTILNAKEKTIFLNTEFSDLKSPLKNGWELMGAVNIHNSEVLFENTSFSRTLSEDSLNIIKSKFEIRDTEFFECKFDCLDTDFSSGKIVNMVAEDCGNDCLDFSGSKIILTKVKLHNIGDKGLSAGEGSNLNASSIEISGKVYIGIASKDNSSIDLQNGRISGAEYGITVYQKKKEYGPSNINIENFEISANKEYLIESTSIFKSNNTIILSGKKDVYKTLYPLNQ